MAENALSEDDRRSLWAQFVAAYDESQKAFDTSVRALAAAGVGITASLATALEKIDPAGIVAAGLFLGSLALNLVSYVTAQFDMRARFGDLRQWRYPEPNRWTVATTVLNALAGTLVVAGGILLAVFVGSAT